MAVRIGPSLALAAVRRRPGARRAPLDGLAPYAALGLRRLFAAYRGPLLRARRAGDDAQADFHPRGDGWLDVTALTAWGGSASVFLVTLYDQTGNGHHAGAASMAAQPRLALAGAADLGPGGRPIAVLDGIDDGLVLADSVGFSQGQAGLTLAAVVCRSGPNATASTQQIIFVPPAGPGGVTRCNLSLFVGDGYRAAAGGRRLDADAYARVTSPTGLAAGSWGRFIARLRYSVAQADIGVNGGVTSGSFLTAGTCAATPQVSGISVGATHVGTDFFAGGLTGVVVAQGALDPAPLDAALTQLLP